MFRILIKLEKVINYRKGGASKMAAHNRTQVSLMQVSIKEEYGNVYRTGHNKYFLNLYKKLYINGKIN